MASHCLRGYFCIHAVIRHRFTCRSAKNFAGRRKDKLFPYTDILAKGTGSADEPLMAYALTMITVGCVLVGELNAIAPLITNFFMSSYALTNFACYSNSIAKTPGWRPTFRYYNKWLSLFGTFLCVIFMFWLNLWMSLATVIGIMLHQSVAFLKPDVNWEVQARVPDICAPLRSLRALETTREHKELAAISSFLPTVLLTLRVPGRLILQACSS